MKKKIKELNLENAGITLIALVITIIVLLILAALSINLTLGENGILSKAKESKILSRAGAAEEHINLWKEDNLIADYSNDEKVTSDTMLENLKTKKLIYEDEIYRDEEIIRIKNSDGIVIKEISYKNSNVQIIITKTPETGESENVVLEVTAVKGLKSIEEVSEEEINQKILKMSEDKKKEMNKILLAAMMSKMGGRPLSFQDFLYAMAKEGVLGDVPEDELEDAFWKMMIGQNEGKNLDEMLGESLKQARLEFNYQVGPYALINPKDKGVNKYIADKNGIYTFTVLDLASLEIYTKSVKVDNIIEGGVRYRIENMIEIDLNNHKGGDIVLYDRELGKFANFEEAYIYHNGEKVNITKWIYENYDGVTYIPTANMFKDIGGQRDEEFTDMLFTLVKDGVEYSGIANIGCTCL